MKAINFDRRRNVKRVQFTLHEADRFCTHFMRHCVIQPVKQLPRYLLLATVTAFGLINTLL